MESSVGRKAKKVESFVGSEVCGSLLDVGCVESSVESEECGALH